MDKASKAPNNTDFDALIEIGFRSDGTSEIVPCPNCEYGENVESSSKAANVPMGPGLYKLLRVVVGGKEKAYRICPAVLKGLPEKDGKYCKRSIGIQDSYVVDDGERVPYNLEPETIGNLVDEAKGDIKRSFNAIGYLQTIDMLENAEKTEALDDAYEFQKKPSEIPKIRVKLNTGASPDNCAWMMGMLYGAIAVDLTGMGYKRSQWETDDAIYVDFMPTEQMKEKLEKGIKKVYGNRLKDKVARFKKKLTAK